MSWPVYRHGDEKKKNDLHEQEELDGSNKRRYHLLMRVHGQELENEIYTLDDRAFRSAFSRP